MSFGPAPGRFADASARDGLPGAVDDAFSGVNARVELTEQHLEDRTEPLTQMVDGPDVVAMSVRQGDPPDRPAGRTGGGDQCIGATRQRRVDERQPVILADEVSVDESKARELDEVLGQRLGAHGQSAPARSVDLYSRVGGATVVCD